MSRQVVGPSNTAPPSGTPAEGRNELTSLCLADRPYLRHQQRWSPERHARHGQLSRAVVVTVLGAAQRPTCPLSRLPLELLFEVFGWTWQGADEVPGPFRPHARPVLLRDRMHFEEGLGAVVAGHIFVGSADARGVAVITRAGKLVRHIGAGILQGCNGVAVVGDQLFATDCRGRRVVVFRLADGALVRAFDAGMKPWGIAAANGMLFVTSRTSQCVRVFREDGTIVRTIEKTVSQAHMPGGIAVCEGEIFVADAWTDRVLVLCADTGAFIGTIGSRWGACTDVCERGGLLFVSAALYVSVLSIADGSFVATLSPTMYPVQGHSPRGLCISDDGILYVACSQGIVSFRVFGEGDAEAPLPLRSVPTVENDWSFQ